MMNIVHVDVATLVFVPGPKESKKGPEYYRRLKESHLAAMAKEKKEAII